MVDRDADRLLSADQSDVRSGLRRVDAVSVGVHLRCAERALRGDQIEEIAVVAQYDGDDADGDQRERDRYGAELAVADEEKDSV